MSTGHKSDSDTVSSKIELATAAWSLQTTVSVPLTPISAKELLPLARDLADAIIRATTESIEDAGKRVSCRKSCGACCRQLVPISEVEARDIRDLVAELPEPRRAQVRARFAQARRRLEDSGLLKKLWHSEQWSEDEVQSLGLEYFFLGIACPFLEEESCSIYSRRPISCREYLVTSPAENCAAPDQKSVTIDLVNVPIKIWPALARLDKTSPAARFIRWVPLILAPEWADAHPTEPTDRPGPEWLRELFANLTGEQAEQTALAEGSTARLSDGSRPQPAAVEEPVPQSIAADGALAQDRELPLRLGSAEDFAHVEALLRAACFDETTVCRVLGVADMSDIGSIPPNSMKLSGQLGVLMRLFIFLESIARSEVERWIAPNSLRHLLALDVLRVSTSESKTVGLNETYHSSVWLYPVANLIIATDRGKRPDGTDLRKVPDVVFPAIYEGTLRFLRVIPRSPAATALDLCSGSGVAALALSKSVDRVIACDITVRACHFAEFNRRLNHASNVEIVQGDLYSALQGEWFDRIVAHPPFVPSSSESLIYRDSGPTGESLIHRIVAGLPMHLRPGGAFYSVCAAWDTKEAPFEERARQWLGNGREEFDILFALQRYSLPREIAGRVAVLNGLDQPEVAQWTDRFRAHGFERSVYGVLAMRRRTARYGRRQPFTRRVQLGDHSTGTSFEGALRWYEWRAQREADGYWIDSICMLAPRLSPSLRARVNYSVQNDSLNAQDAVLETFQPFFAQSKIDPWMMTMIAMFNGERTTAAVYEAARRQLRLPENFALADFATLVGNLIERGYLKVDTGLLNGPAN